LGLRRNPADLRTLARLVFPGRCFPREEDHWRFCPPPSLGKRSGFASRPSPPLLSPFLLQTLKKTAEEVADPNADWTEEADSYPVGVGVQLASNRQSVHGGAGQNLDARQLEERLACDPGYEEKAMAFGVARSRGDGRRRSRAKRLSRRAGR
jgi:hypothetical protein